MQDYRLHRKNYDRQSKRLFGLGVNDLIKIVDKSPEQKKFLKEYYNYSPLFNSNCAMNTLSKYIESIDFDFRYSKKKESFDYTCMMDKPIEELNENKCRKVFTLVKRYNKINADITRNLKGITINMSDEDTKDLKKALYDAFYEDFVNDMVAIVGNIKDCVNYLCWVFYVQNYSSQRSLLWYCFGDNIVENVKANSRHRYSVVHDEHGQELFGEKYTIVDNYIQDTEV